MCGSCHMGSAFVRPAMRGLFLAKRIRGGWLLLGLLLLLRVAVRRLRCRLLFGGFSGLARRRLSVVLMCCSCLLGLWARCVMVGMVCWFG